ncbi:hypothetical protein P3X46_033583 [Hevea brasiliensis]|uniref:Nucleoside phosphorylase domain-containing protein n=1 Tax=Hevea brasiliensis TaxID=3981 RepID=A0ABQ9KBR8_HEVBR|nr:hypothetical protein P3X46_033583 [Hevea brasiliensis]
MAPDGEGSDASDEAMLLNDLFPISSLSSVLFSFSGFHFFLCLYNYANEAMPVVNKFQLTKEPEPGFPKGVPWVRYYGIYKDIHINFVWPGKDSNLGVDSIGTVSASLVTYAAIQALQPDLIINAGTAGGFKAKGASIGDVYLVSDVAFHDRRIPIPVFDLYGVGLLQAYSTPNLPKDLNLKFSCYKAKRICISQQQGEATQKYHSSDFSGVSSVMCVQPDFFANLIE